jgi:hypothetical protein
LSVFALVVLSIAAAFAVAALVLAGFGVRHFGIYAAISSIVAIGMLAGGLHYGQFGATVLAVLVVLILMITAEFAVLEVLLSKGRREWSESISDFDLAWDWFGPIMFSWQFSACHSRSPRRFTTQIRTPGGQTSSTTNASGSAQSNGMEPGFGRRRNAAGSAISNDDSEMPFHCECAQTSCLEKIELHAQICEPILARCSRWRSSRVTGRRPEKGHGRSGGISGERGWGGPVTCGLFASPTAGGVCGPP